MKLQPADLKFALSPSLEWGSDGANIDTRASASFWRESWGNNQHFDKQSQYEDIPNGSLEGNKHLMLDIFKA